MLGILSLEAGRSRIDINGLSWQPTSRPSSPPPSSALLHLCDSSRSEQRRRAAARSAAQLHSPPNRKQNPNLRKSD